jgi:hypothetical protein
MVDLSTQVILVGSAGAVVYFYLFPANVSKNINEFWVYLSDSINKIGGGKSETPEKHAYGPY